MQSALFAMLAAASASTGRMGARGDDVVRGIVPARRYARLAYDQVNAGRGDPFASCLRVPYLRILAEKTRQGRCSVPSTCNVFSDIKPRSDMPQCRSCPASSTRSST